MHSAVSCAACASRSIATTRAPSRAYATAAALPLLQPSPEEPAPNTSATLSCRRFICLPMKLSDRTASADALELGAVTTTPLDVFGGIAAQRLDVVLTQLAQHLGWCPDDQRVVGEALAFGHHCAGGDQ